MAETTTPPAADLPNLPQGVPSLQQLDKLMETPHWKRVKAFNNAFLDRHRESLKGYGFRWGEDPMGLWSRRWEYPWVVGKVFEYAQETGRDDFLFCDAGSGVTFFPYLVCEQLPETKFVCCDYEPKYGPMFDAVNQTESHDRVSFKAASLQDMPFKDGELDGLTCISVLEHTGDYRKCVEEIARCIKPGGLLVLTFDLSLDPKFPKFELRPESAKDLLSAIGESFDVDEDMLWSHAERAYASSDGLLSTPEIRKTQPQLLPWKYPLVQSFYDLWRGYGWTGGFRSVAPLCMAATRK